MNKTVRRIIIIASIILGLALYYYIFLPPINIHSVGFWIFTLFALVISIIVYIIKKRMNRYEIKASKPVKILIGVTIGVFAIFLFGGILSSPLVNAKKYQRLLDVQVGEFTADIEELSFEQIPILDKDSAKLLGNRKMGSMVDMVSQFEVDEIYTQINYRDKPVRVSPLKYANVIKWMTNQSEGIPAYIRIDMATQETELVKLEQGIKYSTSEHFNRNIYRHLRFKYPTYIFEDLSFEINEEGTPYWVCPVAKFNIGLFGGKTIGRVVLCNAITGETKDYSIDKVPQWVDRAYSADLLIELYDYYGTLKHGYLNSVFGQKDCLETTDGYNYLAIDDDVWVYTGVTSVSGDQSNVGFVLMNQRTMETKFYEIEGATEQSAMDSAEGQVQNLKYEATFPLLLNISDEPTYFIALKDNAGLVKKYAMVNVQKYQLVGIGDTVGECEENYKTLLQKDGLLSEGQDDDVYTTGSVTGKIQVMEELVIEGNTHYYVMLEGSENVYDVIVPGIGYGNISIIKYEIGQEITLEYLVSDKTGEMSGEELPSGSKVIPVSGIQ